MASLVQSSKYGAIDTNEKSINVYYVIKFISQEYIVQNNITIDEHILTYVELVVKEKYL